MKINTYPPLVAYTWQVNSQIEKLIKNIVLIILGTLFLTVSSKISIPLYIVPFTMQTFAVLLIGGMYGSKLGVITILTYLLEGALGLPVFALGGGIAYFTGPTAGYLFGFIVASYITGLASELGQDRVIIKSLIWFAIAHISIFVFGVAWLTYLFGFTKALHVGLYPFIAGMIIKFTLASLCLKFLWNTVGFKFQQLSDLK